MIRVLIVEDIPEHQLYFKTVVNNEMHLHCVGVAGDAETAIVLAEQERPDVVLMDIGLPGTSGIECIKILRARYPEMKFMVCTVHEEDDNVFEALKAGAHSYIVKRSKPHQVVDAINEVYKGESPISSCIATKVLHSLPQLGKEKQADLNAERYSLSKKEQQILSELAKGLTYVEIAGHVHISVSALRWHVHNIYSKLHVSNRMEAINRYYGTDEAEGEG